jgi:hypothetical protein
MTDEPGELIDATDEAVLRQLAALYAELDPPPADLDDRVSFAIGLENADIEIARLVEEELVGSGARGTERTRTITFDAESRTIMLTVSEIAHGRVRIDGWLAPPAGLTVELRFGDRSLTTVADEAGRFVFDGVDHGLAQVLVHPGAADDRSSSVVTPSMTL